MAARERLREKRLATSMRSRTNVQPIEVLWGNNTVLFAQAPNTPRADHANPLDDEGEKIIPRLWRP